jgi:rare lipoprotein A
MNKIIPAISVLVLCGCATKQIKTTEASIKTDETAQPAHVSITGHQNASPLTPVAFTQPSSYKRHLSADRPFRHHTVIPINKPVEHDEPEQQENLIPRIAHSIQRGIASWYGKKFHGKKTATGEIFDMYALTAAHKTLPIPSYAQITNLENNKSVIVRINDRGPFVGNRLLDLSYAAAKKLDIQKDGLAKVEIKSLAEEELQNDDEDQEKNIYLQLGVFNNPDNAQKLQDKVAAHDLPEPEILPSNHNFSTSYKVQIGPIKSQSGADKLTIKLARLGITGTQIVTEPKKSNGTMIE